MYQKYLNEFIETAVKESSTTLSIREHNLLDSFAIWLNLHAVEQSVQADETTGHPIADAVQDLVHYIESDEA